MGILYNTHCVRLFLVFAWNFIVYGNFLGRGPFSGNNYGKSANCGARNQRPDSRRKRTSNFSVRKILLFLAHLKSSVPATVDKNFAFIFISTTFGASGGGIFGQFEYGITVFRRSQDSECCVGKKTSTA